MAFGGVQIPRTLLCVNVSRVAALRTARGGKEPDPVEAARICTKTGCNSIAVRLREDRRHIKDRDVVAIRKAIPENGKVYLEIALSRELIDLARRVRPSRVTIVPEKNEDMTPNRGLDVRENIREIGNAVGILNKEDIPVSLFIEPDTELIDLSKECGARFVEINTSAYSRATLRADIDREIDRIYKASEHAAEIRIMINAGCGLNYTNVAPLVRSRELLEFNIGQAIVSRADSVGLSTAVEEMMAILD
jgi:pyridoxine 5-phosphate synthase